MEMANTVNSDANCVSVNFESNLDIPTCIDSAVRQVCVSDDNDYRLTTITYNLHQRRSKPLKNGTASFFSLQKSGTAKAMFGRTSFKSGTAGFLIEFLTTSYIGYILFIIIKSTSTRLMHIWQKNPQIPRRRQKSPDIGKNPQLC